ncbi:MAG: CRTAC1 family protein [Phycisphaerae bacterium]
MTDSVSQPAGWGRWRRVRASAAVTGLLSIATTTGRAEAVIPSTEEAVERGLSYVMQNAPQTYGYVGFGCGFADLDGDYDQDVVILGAADGHVGLFENDGTGHFSDRSAGSGIAILTQGSGLAAADYDGDGDIDLYLTQVALPNVLYRNDGLFQFIDVTMTAGVGDPGASMGACFADFDGDGRLDLYVCNQAGGIAGPPDQRNVLYHNLGQGVFDDVSAAQTVDDPGFGFEAVWTDYDRDGDVDLYLSNDKGHQPPLFRANQLWRNDAGQLVNVSAASGAGIALWSMGLACGDFDGNGWPDLYCTNIPTPLLDNPLLLNQGDGTFIEAGVVAGVNNPFVSWGAIFFDFDNNGHLDLYVNNSADPNTLYLNSGAYPAVEVAAAAKVTAGSGRSFSSAVADVDADGDLDLLVNNLDGNVQLFINHEGETRRWIRYDVVGQGANRFAVGGSVDTRIQDMWQFREVLAGGNGYLGQNELTLHVGADLASTADEVVVTWPGGATRTLTNLATNRTWRIYPPERLGDMDGDGDVDANDLAVFVAVLLGTDPTPDRFFLSDMNGDGLADGLDIMPFIDAMLLP